MEGDAKGDRSDPLLYEVQAVAPSSEEKKVPIAHAARGRLDDIEVLRAVAITITFVGHLGELLPWGGPVLTWVSTALWGGVDLFFCISRFCRSRGACSPSSPKVRGVPDFIRFTFHSGSSEFFLFGPLRFFGFFIALVLDAVFSQHGTFRSILRANLGDVLSAVLQVANLHYLWCASRYSA